MLLLARKKPVLALLLAVLNAMIAGNAMNAERVLAREEDHLRFHIGQKRMERTWRKLEAGNSYIRIHLARNRQASVSTITGGTSSPGQMIRLSRVSRYRRANTRYGGNSMVRLSSVRILIERTMHHRLLHILYRARAALR